MGIRYDGVVGIDLSLTSTGVVRIAEDEGIEVKEIKTGANFWMPLRQRSIARDVLSFVIDHDLVLIEGYSFGSLRKGTHDLAELGGLVKHYLYETLGRYPTVIPPTSLKKFAAGRGNADKASVAVGVFKRFGFEHPSNDVIDAYVLARMGEMLIGRGPEPRAHEREVLAKIPLGPEPPK